MNRLVCSECNASFPLSEPIFRCSRCNGLLDIIFNAVLNPEKIVTRPPTLWRYREAIPVNTDAEIITLGEGFTPLTKLNIQGRQVLVKQDQLFPSGSFKDRGSTVLITHTKYLGITEVVEDSSGNAGASIAAYCARAGIHCEIYVPDRTSPSKTFQITQYGGKLMRMPGNRDDIARFAVEKAKSVYYASHYVNPFFFQGIKTFAYEICEQMNWTVPDVIVLPVGNGSLLLGAAIGFRDLIASGITRNLPKLIAVQSKHCAPIYHSLYNSHRAHRHSDSTVAEGIAVSEPPRLNQIVQTIRDFQGSVITVSENEIRSALSWAWKQGYCIEPTSAVVIAGLNQYLQQTQQNEVIVSTFTGHGLKSLAYTTT